MSSRDPLPEGRESLSDLGRAVRRGWLLAAFFLCTIGVGAAESPLPVASPTAGKGVTGAEDGATGGSPEAPEETVRWLCEARKALDARQMEAVLADDYRGMQPDGSEIPYDRERGRQTTDWERAMNTRWDYRILGVDGNAVAVLLTEQSAYFDLLEIGTRTQVTVYFVEGEKVARSLSKLDVQERGSQAQEFRRFNAWLREQMKPPEPGLVGPDGRLIFDGQSGGRMLAWLKKWHEARNGSAPASARE